ncbi:hypothetical protein BTM25_20250 [Actinomadura rubteroloni]|uniref:Uncharacterized protein n=1 Tax=Actinomadura rubteroloni TaxID=1926885 RepID=A0A2P4URC7_9ACTN|nr:hypothetical protein [Actinomadura rubteroloni]POM27609.1 hypothetical protein BTM25_20250 [Actinomadura rubteroloni]
MEYRRGPFGIGRSKGATLTAERTVLAVVHHVTAATRLADVLPLVERDRRVQVVYTVAPASVLSVGATEYLRAAGAVEIPFEQAAQNRFDLAVSAGDGALQHVNAPVLLLQHGMGPSVAARRWDGAGPPVRRPLAGLARQNYVAGGRVIASAIGLSHPAQRRQLLDVVPEAERVAHVVGDPAYDRVEASFGRRDAYRDALGVGPGRRLVFVTSTWGGKGLVGSCPDILRRLVTELPAERYVVAAALHPVIWNWHGRRQVLAWTSDAPGLRLLPPEEGWRAAIVAADVVLGDCGSVTAYSAAAGRPGLLGAFPDRDVAPDSTAEAVGRIFPRLDLDGPLVPQFEGCIASHRPDRAATLRDRLTGEPGRAAPRLRALMYKMMDLPEPESPASTEPVPLPEPIGGPVR